MTKLFTAISERRWAVLGALVLITTVMGIQASRLEVNATPYFLDRSHPSRVADAFVKSTFLTSGESMFITVVAAEETVFNPDTLRTIYELTHKLEAATLARESDSDRLLMLARDSTSRAMIQDVLVDGFAPDDLSRLRRLAAHFDTVGPLSRTERSYLEDLMIRVRPVVKVRSLVTVESITANGDTLDIHPMMYRVPETDAGIRALREEALSNRLLQGGLFARDGKATNLQMELAIPQDDSPNMEAMYDATVAILDSIKSKDSFHLGGSPVITTQTAVAMEKDTAAFFPGVILIVLAILYLAVRRPVGIFAPLLISIISVIWTLGTMAALGVKQNIVSTMLPVFLISISVVDALHLLIEYYSRLSFERPKEALSSALGHLWRPMLMTTLTTAVGFVSLAYTDIRFIREFGLFVALGTVYALIITCTLLPALLAFGAAKATAATRPRAPAVKAIERLMRDYSAFIDRRWAISLALTAAVAGVSLYGLKDLRVDNKAIGYFAPDSRIRQDDAVINSFFGGAILMNISFRADKAGAFKDPATIAAMEKVQDRLHTHSDIGYTYGMPDFLKLINKAMHDDDSQYRLPTKANEIAEYLLLYESSSGRGLFDVVDQKFQNARIVAFSHSDQSSVFEKTLTDTLTYAQTVLPSGVKVEGSGFGEILVSTKNEVVYGQIASLIISFVAVVGLLAWQFRSVVVGLLAGLPTGLTVLLNFALMPRIGVVLDIGTVIVAGIAIGVGVDYAIHLISRLRHEAKSTHDSHASMRTALERTAVPIVFNTVVVGLGFAVLTASSFAALVNLGWLVSATMFVSAFTTLFVLPPLLLAIRPKALFAPAEQSITGRNASLPTYSAEQKHHIDTTVE